MSTLTKTLFLIAMLATSASALAQDIAYVEATKNWYYVYDQKGRKLSSLSANNGELKGYSSTFYVIATKNWVYTYDAKSRKIATVSANNVGTVIGVAGDTFTSRNGSWIYIWDKNCKKVGTRSASR